MSETIPAIKVENVTKVFKIPHEKHTTMKSAAINLFSSHGFEMFTALSDVSFEVKQGEFFGIIGRNGSGKSTLLKILAGIYVANQGTVTINGKFSPFLELGVGFNPELTARENVFLGGAMLGLSRKEVAEKFDKIVEFSELEEFIDMKFKNFSSGMQVRLAFALAINAHADILLMDEVLAVGDTNFQKKCLNEFNRYKEMGKTVVLVSHDIETIKRYCDRVMWVKDSKVKMIGDTTKVCDMYSKSNMEEVQSRKVQSDLGETDSLAYIKKVEFLSKGKPVDAIPQGGDLGIRVYFDSKDKKKNLNFGLAIFSEGEHYIFGVNTFEDKADTDKYKKNGYFEVNFKNIPLRSGLFYAKAGIWGDNNNDQYDFLDSVNFFSVTPSDKNQGEIAIDYEWS